MASRINFTFLLIILAEVGLWSHAKETNRPSVLKLISPVVARTDSAVLLLWDQDPHVENEEFEILPEETEY